MSEWKEYILKDIIERFIDYRGKTPKKVEQGIPLITAKVVKNGRIEEPNEFISPEDYDIWMTRGFPKMNDVVLTTEAPLGEVALLKSENVALAQRIITLRGKENICDNIFLKYYLQSNEGQAALHSRASGSTVEGIKSSVLKVMEVSLPAFPEQTAIAEVLSSLDDKIDLLHRQNKTLEALAETLFWQWFVEEAEDSWEDGKLGDLVDFVYGKKLKETERSGKGFPVVGSSGIVGYHDEYLVKGPGLVTGRKGTLGKITYLYENFSPIDTTFYITSKSGSENFCFEYFLLQSIHLEEFNTDSAVPGLNRNIALSAEVQIPPSHKIEFFNETVNPYFQKMLINHTQIRTLTRLRDTLLPKLMSGEVRVKI